MNSVLSMILRNRLFVLAIVLVVSGAGVLSLSRLAVDAVPDISNVQVVVNTKTGPLSPEQIERQVTFVIENEIAGTPGIEEIRSLSKYGLSQVTVIFSDATDVYFARQLIGERLRAMNLPYGLAPELGPVSTGLGEVFMYTLDFAADAPQRAKMTEEEQLMALRQVQQYRVRPELRRIPGVADVDTGGGYRREIHINIFPERLKTFGLTLLELKQLLQRVGENRGGSYIEKGDEQVIVSFNGELRGIEDVAQLPVKQVFGGKVLRLKEIADIKVESSLRLGAATSNGRETVLGTVLMRAGANSRDVAHRAAEQLEKLGLPQGMIATPVYSRAYLVDATIQTVGRNLAEGALLVIIILILFLGDLRAAALVALTIPISMLGAAIGMHLFGMSANLMSLGAIDFGLIVDGSVVLVENMIRRAGDLRLANDRRGFFVESTVEVLRPIFLGVGIIMIVYVPVLFLGGIEGKMFRPMALTVLLALGTSLLLSFFFIPAASSIVLKIDHPHAPPWVFQLFERIYDRILKRVFLHPKWTLAGAAGVGICALGILLRMGSDFIPQLDEGDLVIGLMRSSAQSLSASIRDQIRSENLIRKFPEVERVFSRMGTPESATDPMGVYLADTFVILKKDHKSWPVMPELGRPRLKAEVFEAMKEKLSAAAAQDITPTQPIEMRFNEILEGSRADVSLRIYGTDLDQLAKLIERAKALMQGMPGLASAESDALTALTKSPVLQFRPDANLMVRAGITHSDLRDVFEFAMSGLRVGTLYEAEREVPIVMHLDESLRARSEAIAELPVDGAMGGRVELGNIGHLAREERVTTIARSWGERYSALSLFVRGRDIQSFVEEAQMRLQKALELPEGYKLHWGGQFKNMAEARLRLLILTPVTLLIILFLLHRYFGAWQETLLVFAAIPFAMIGGVFALALRGMNMTVPASIGFIALAGISVLNSVVMVGFISELIRGGLDSRSAVQRGARLRLRPVLMTAMVAMLGFIPMAINQGIGAEVQRPLATVVIGGLITATAMTLLLLPLLCDRLLARTRRNF